MKKIILFVFIYSSLTIACDRVKLENDVENSSVRFTIIRYSDVTYVIDNEDSIAYFVQYENPESVKFQELNSLRFDSKKGSLTIDDAKKGQIIINLDENVFGIGLTNSYDVKKLLLQGKGRIRARSDGYYDFSDIEFGSGSIGDAVKCGCIKENEKKHPSNCKAGGIGATECSITDSGGVASLNWNNSCQVSCGSGRYACCATGNNFIY